MPSPVQRASSHREIDSHDRPAGAHAGWRVVLAVIVVSAWVLFGWSVATTVSLSALLLVPVALAAADLFSAGVHLLFDSLPERLPIARDFHFHHRHPGNVLRQGYVEYVIRSVYVFLPVMAAVIWSPLGPGATFFVAVWGMFVVHNELFHGWAHHPSPPAAVVRLQALGILMRPEHHERHHATLDCNYGVINGWSDPLVNGTLRLARRVRTRFAR